MALVLVVDDEVRVRGPLEKLLHKHGYETVGAADAFQAMAAAKKRKPDLILLDVMIPPMDGLTFLMLLRDDPHGHNVPVILLTGLSDENTAHRAKDLGVKEYLIKSEYTPKQLLELVDKYVGEGAKAAG